MDSLIAIITTPLFWILSALGSVILSVIGNLVTPRIASWLTYRSETRQKRERKKRAQKLGEVIIRVYKPEKIIHTKLNSLHSFLLACVLMLFTLILFTMATALEWLIVPLVIRLMIVILAIPILWLSFYLLDDGVKWRAIAILAERRIDEYDQVNSDSEGDDAKVRAHMAEWDQKNFGITTDEVGDALK